MERIVIHCLPIMTMYIISPKKEASLRMFSDRPSLILQKWNSSPVSKEHPVRHLTKSEDNTLCFTYNGEIYTLKAGGRPQKITVNIFNDGREAVEKVQRVNGNVTEFAVSPNGKEIAFVTRGEVFVTSVEGSQTKRITNTPAQERMVQWAPDGKSLIYAAERNDNWDIYIASITRKEEPYFYAATVLERRAIDRYQCRRVLA